MRKQLSTGVIAFVVAGLIAVGAAAGAATNDNAIQNGGFETGKFKPWKTDGGPGNGLWVVYDDGGPFFPPPAEGDFAAGAFQFAPTGMTLTQKFRLRQTGPSVLFFLLAYAEFGEPGAPQSKTFGAKTPTPRCAPDAKIPCGGFFCNPDTIRVDLECNQQLRVDILKANADPKSFADKDILETLFVTEDDAPPFMDWTPMSFDLTQFAGRQVQLRFLVAVTEAPIAAAVDAVGIYHSAG
jgi:hypothetical protein